MATVIVLYGPKAVGKTEIARLLQSELDCQYLDCDVFISGLLRAGVRPHPTDGWLEHVEHAVEAALRHSDRVSVEATGAWPTDWRMARDLVEMGHVVLRVWITTSWPVSLERLRSRNQSDRVPTSEGEAEAIYEAATSRASQEAFDLVLDTTDPLDAHKIVASMAELLGT